MADPIIEKNLPPKDVLIETESFRAVDSNGDSVLISKKNALNYTFEAQKNKFDKDSMVIPDEGISNTGVIGPQAGWTGARIPVTENTIYSFVHNDGLYGASQVGLLQYQDENQDEISSIDMSALSNAGGNGGKTLTTPAGCAFIYKNVVVLASDYLNDFQLEAGNGTSDFEAYELRITEIDTFQINAANVSELEVRVDTAESNITTNTDDIASLQESLEVTETSDFLEYTGAFADAGNGTISINNKTNVNNVKISKILLNTTSTTVAGANSFYLYTVDGSQVVTKDYGEINITASPSSLLEVEVDVLLDAGDRVAIAFNTGLGVRYNGASSTGFEYSPAPSQRDFIVGETITTNQSFATIIGYGWEGVELTGETKDVAAVSDVIQLGINNLYQKDIGINGDSMAYGHTIPNDGWGKLLSDKHDMAYTNDAINGSWLTNGAGSSNPLIDRYSAMSDDHDIVIIWVGTNDAHAGVSLGVNTSTDNAEFYGALNNLCDGLLTKYPTKKLLFITPMNRAAIENITYVDAMIEICQKFNIEVFDAYRESGISFDNTAQYNALTLQDTYHLNAAGMQYILARIENRVNGI